MKKLFLLCLSLLIFYSCSLEDDNDVILEFEFMPIENISIPEAFFLGEIYDIEMTYFRPTNCHVFHDYYSLIDDNTITIAVINAVSNNADCETLENELMEVSFEFKAVYDQVYIFKFWQGEDENGNDVYLTYEVPVLN